MRLTFRLTAIATMASLAACATTPAPDPDAQRAAQLQQQLDTSRAEQTRLQNQIVALRSQPPPPPPQAAPPDSDDNSSLPSYAKPGECYARVVVPPKFKTETEQAIKTAASEKVEVVPAQYEWAEETVLVQPAYEKVVRVIPAQYRTVEERVLVKPAGKKLTDVPATYKTVTEKQLVKPAHTEWKRGHGLIEKTNEATGEIMCLVEVPAEYRTVTSRVVDTPATTRETEIPAEYTTVKKQELVKEATVEKVTVPAVYKTVKVRKEVSPAGEKRIPIPATYQTVSKQVQVADGYTEWRAVLCQTNATPATITRIQTALKGKGFDPGPIDGVLGAETAAAIKSFQKASGLSQGGVTIETLDKLGVSLHAGI
ncbi:MAG: peptidoglycan-binding domain-containing protein [Solimonas sp.]